MRQRDCAGCGATLDDHDYKGSATWDEVRVCVTCRDAAFAVWRLAALVPRTSFGDVCPACGCVVPDRCTVGCPTCHEPRDTWGEPEAADA